MLGERNKTVDKIITGNDVYEQNRAINCSIKSNWAKKFIAGALVLACIVIIEVLR